MSQTQVRSELKRCTDSKIDPHDEQVRRFHRLLNLSQHPDLEGHSQFVFLIEFFFQLSIPNPSMRRRTDRLNKQAAIAHENTGTS